MKKRQLLVANWKMNKNSRDTLDFMVEFSKLLGKKKIKADIVICPPFTSLFLRAKTKNKNINFGAQNIFSENSGSFTGEISPLMIKDFCSYIIIGHSERRNLFSETNTMINKKIAASVNNKLIPILCVGEQLHEREEKNTKNVIEHQLNSCLDNIKVDGDNLVIAYEPVWAIGTGNEATNEQIDEVVSFIRDRISQMYSEDVSKKIKILYGGSVNLNNIQAIMNISGVDGALIGGASLNPENFHKMIISVLDKKKDDLNN